jgi:hypothetical protein
LINDLFYFCSNIVLAGCNSKSKDELEATLNAECLKEGGLMKGSLKFCNCNMCNNIDNWQCDIEAPTGKGGETGGGGGGTGGGGGGTGGGGGETGGGGGGGETGGGGTGGSGEGGDATDGGNVGSTIATFGLLLITGLSLWLAM